MARAVIRCEDLTKHYGTVVGIDGLDLEVGGSEVFGFLGPNGAGKTTTIRLLLDLLHPTRGRVEVLGTDVSTDPVAVRRRMGYLPGDLALYGTLTVDELLRWFGHLRGLDRPPRVDELCERLDLDRGRRVGALSTGNRQKVGIVQALMHDPDVLVLDEPTRGLDPLVQREFNRLVHDLRERGRTVFLSSHLLDEVEAVADRVGIVRDGRLVAVETLDTLRTKTAARLTFRFAAPVPPERFVALPGVQRARVEGAVAEFLVDGPVDALVKAAAEFEVMSVVSREPELEDVFLSFYGPDAG